MKKAMILAAALLFSQMAFAQFYKGRDLKKWSDGSEKADQGTANATDYQSSAMFSGYVAGVVDAHQKTFFCIPIGSELSQAKAIVRKYLVNNPEKWGESAEMIILFALGPVFPCKKE